MDYQETINLKIGVSGAGKNYLKMPWGIEDTIENLEELREMMQQRLIMTNYHGRGEKDAEEIAFDFNRAIQALKENQEYKKLGTLEEVREAVEKQKRKKPCASNRCYVCPHCGLVASLKIKHNYCDACGQQIDWSEKE